MIRALVELTKPRITIMVTATALAGAVIAPGQAPLGLTVATLVGTGAVVGAANALNMYLERDVDAQMVRTRERPIPSGRIGPRLALAFGIVLAVCGLALLTAFVNPLAASLCALGFASYVFVYTPLKRKTPLALHVGTIPGAIPPLIGWAAARGRLEPAAFSLFAIMVVWQIPHFLAIAAFRGAEYERAGLPVYGVARGKVATQRAMLGYSIALVLISFAPIAFGLGNTAYLLIALGLGLLQLALASYAFSSDVTFDRAARRVFVVSMPYLLVLLGGLALTAS